MQNRTSRRFWFRLLFLVMESRNSKLHRSDMPTDMPPRWGFSSFGMVGYNDVTPTELKNRSSADAPTAALIPQQWGHGEPSGSPNDYGIVQIWPRLLKLGVSMMLFGTWSAGFPALSADLRVGAAAVNITPPPGIGLAGYYFDRGAQGTNDDLFAKALVLEQDGVQAAFVALDLISTTRPMVEASRREIEKTTVVRGDQVM